ncbi:flavodoxin family protein [Phytoactinopolyspora mesophila]|uniref:Flavodoxin n=1 Tax=Phytoactinopolyspora mesophila TaxID=2650750 RepID=A0A7K3MEN7_9ACTN|nr:flavodoxin domain-containing protein [Phytoactinopolyspora mesophila]NDL60868.1 flavodoxin [Phytoactinopolyspora mesophila]
MRALIVYESMFGNTFAIATSIAEGLAPHMTVEVVEVSEAPTELGPDFQLIVVGGPTHAFGMSRPDTRRTAADKTENELVSPGGGIREWLEAMSHVSPRTAAATFDTRVNRLRVPGSAARAAARRLRRLGFDIIARPQSFRVTEMTGPTVDGEMERAAEWGLMLGAEEAKRNVDRSSTT